LHIGEEGGKQEKPRIAVGPGNARVIIRQVSSDAATFGSARRAAAAASAYSTAIRQFTN